MTNWFISLEYDLSSFKMQLMKWCHISYYPIFHADGKVINNGGMHCKSCHINLLLIEYL